jgi:hypothetical protein
VSSVSGSVSGYAPSTSAATASPAPSIAVPTTKAYGAWCSRKSGQGEDGVGSKRIRGVVAGVADCAPRKTRPHPPMRGAKGSPSPLPPTPNPYPRPRPPHPLSPPRTDAPTRRHPASVDKPPPSAKPLSSAYKAQSCTTSRRKRPDEPSGEPSSGEPSSGEPSSGEAASRRAAVAAPPPLPPWPLLPTAGADGRQGACGAARAWATWPAPRAHSTTYLWALGVGRWAVKRNHKAVFFKKMQAQHGGS